MPKVSFIIGIFDGNIRHVTNSIDSILNQTYTDFECIIIDDGSGQEVAMLLEAYSHQDDRIRLIRNPKNIGLTRSLNIGLNAAEGQYVARMDADDISYPNRLELQVSFLDVNPMVALVGSRFEELVNNVIIPQRLPFVKGSDILRSIIFYFNPFCHSTIMARREVLVELGGYDESYRHAQDYDFWLRLTAHYTTENLDFPLLLRRMEDGISVNQEQSQRRFAIRARYNAICRHGFQLRHALPLLRSVTAYLVGKRGQLIYRSLIGGKRS
jgi:glycosyltransferase involved in cell wall biosynthesis